uniref:Actin-binding transcription modulator n=1 Tax=Arundo donax TaxID=35708 RepID=A0A0A9DUK5_ARUDO
MKVTGKRKRNAQHLQENSALCKVSTNDKSFVVRLVPLILQPCMSDIIVFCTEVLFMLNFYRCCVKGSLLEINDRLIKQPDLLNTSVSTYHVVCQSACISVTLNTLLCCPFSFFL